MSKGLRQVFLDTETTGLEIRDGNRIIEIGCVEMIDRKLTGNNYHQYIQPDRESEEGALKVHGITSDFLSDKPRFNEPRQSRPKSRLKFVCKRAFSRFKFLPDTTSTESEPLSKEKSRLRYSPEIVQLLSSCFFDDDSPSESNPIFSAFLLGLNSKRVAIPELLSSPPVTAKLLFMMPNGTEVIISVPNK